MNKIIFFVDRYNDVEVYRKICVKSGSDAYDAIYDICCGEVGDGWNVVSEYEYEELVNSGELVETPDMTEWVL